MYRPAFVPKLRISYAKTWAQLTRFLKQPHLIKPAETPEHLRAALAPQKTIKRPQLKGNLVHSLKEIITIFMADWQRAARPLNLAIQTTRASLAKRCRNLDPKTSYRHILALIDYGFLRAKVHVKGGLQLLLNPDLIVFDAAPAVQQAALAPAYATVPTAPLVSPQEGLASLLAAGQNFVRHGRRAT
ncbi:MAG: hypothetical protein ACRYFZ_18195 [Janthinobacterium lividum]